MARIYSERPVTTQLDVGQAIISSFVASLDSHTKTALQDFVCLCTDQITGFVNASVTFKLQDITVHVSIYDTGQLAVTLDYAAPISFTCSAALFHKYVALA